MLRLHSDDSRKRRSPLGFFYIILLAFLFCDIKTRLIIYVAKYALRFFSSRETVLTSLGSVFLLLTAERQMPLFLSAVSSILRPVTDTTLLAPRPESLLYIQLPNNSICPLERKVPGMIMMRGVEGSKQSSCCVRKRTWYSKAISHCSQK